MAVEIPYIMTGDCSGLVDAARASLAAVEALHDADGSVRISALGLNELNAGLNRAASAQNALGQGVVFRASASGMTEMARQIDGVQNQVQALTKSIGSLGSVGMSIPGVSNAGEGLNSLTKGMQDAASAAAKSADTVQGSTSKMAQGLSQLRQYAEGGETSVANLGSQAEQTGATIGNFRNTVAQAQNAIRALSSSANDTAGAMGETSRAADELGSRMSDAQKAITAGPTAALTDMNRAAGDVTSGMKELTASTSQFTQGASAFTGSTGDMAAQFHTVGKQASEGAANARRYGSDLSGAADGVKDFSSSLGDSANSFTAGADGIGAATQALVGSGGYADALAKVDSLHQSVSASNPFSGGIGFAGPTSAGLGVGYSPETIGRGMYGSQIATQYGARGPRAHGIPDRTALEGSPTFDAETLPELPPGLSSFGFDEGLTELEQGVADERAQVERRARGALESTGAGTAGKNYTGSGYRFGASPGGEGKPFQYTSGATPGTAFYSTAGGGTTTDPFTGDLVPTGGVGSELERRGGSELMPYTGEGRWGFNPPPYHDIGQFGYGWGQRIKEGAGKFDSLDDTHLGGMVDTMGQLGGVGMAGSMIGGLATAGTAAVGLGSVYEVMKQMPVAFSEAQMAVGQFNQAMYQSVAATELFGDDKTQIAAADKLKEIGSAIHNIGDEVGKVGMENMGTALQAVNDVLDQVTPAMKQLEPAIKPAIQGMASLGEAVLQGVSSPGAVQGISALGKTLADPDVQQGIAGLVSGAVTSGGVLGTIMGHVASAIGGSADTPAAQAGLDGALAGLLMGPKGLGGKLMTAGIGGIIMAAGAYDQSQGIDPTSGAISGGLGAFGGHAIGKKLGGESFGKTGGRIGSVLGTIGGEGVDYASREIDQKTGNTVFGDALSAGWQAGMGAAFAGGGPAGGAFAGLTTAAGTGLYEAQKQGLLPQGFDQTLMEAFGVPKAAADASFAPPEGAGSGAGDKKLPAPDIDKDFFKGAPATGAYSDSRLNDQGTLIKGTRSDTGAVSFENVYQGGRTSSYSYDPKTGISTLGGQVPDGQGGFTGAQYMENRAGQRFGTGDDGTVIPQTQDTGGAAPSLPGAPPAPPPPPLPPQDSGGNLPGSGSGGPRPDTGGFMDKLQSAMADAGGAQAPSGGDQKTVTGRGALTPVAQANIGTGSGPDNPIGGQSSGGDAMRLPPDLPRSIFNDEKPEIAITQMDPNMIGTFDPAHPTHAFTTNETQIDQATVDSISHGAWNTDIGQRGFPIAVNPHQTPLEQYQHEMDVISHSQLAKEMQNYEPDKSLVAQYDKNFQQAPPQQTQQSQAETAAINGQASALSNLASKSHEATQAQTALGTAIGTVTADAGKGQAAQTGLANAQAANTTASQANANASQANADAMGGLSGNAAAAGAALGGVSANMGNTSQNAMGLAGALTGTNLGAPPGQPDVTGELGAPGIGLGNISADVGLGSLGTAVSANASAVTSGVASAATGAISAAAPAVNAAAADVGSGIGSSLGSGAGGAASTGNAATGGASAGAAGADGTGSGPGSDSHSPSRKSYQVGLWIGEGLVVGMKESEPSVARAGASLGNASVVSTNNAVSEAAGGAVSAITNSVTQAVYDTQLAGGFGAGLIAASNGVMPIAQDYGLMLGYSWAQNVVTGAQSVFQSSQFQSLTTPAFKSALAQTDLGKLGLLPPAGSGAEYYTTTSGSAGMVQMQPVTYSPTINISIGGQTIQDVAYQVVDTKLDDLVHAIGAQTG